MKAGRLTRSQKFWIAALGLGVVALTIDQLTGGASPPAAGAAPLKPSAVEQAAGPVPAATTGLPHPSDVVNSVFNYHLAESLNSLPAADAATAGDAWRCSPPSSGPPS